MINFKKDEETAVLHSPLRGFEIDSQPIEYQKDLLSRFTSFVRTGRAIWAGIKIISRSSVQTYPVSDTWYSSSILLDGFVVEPPEEIAKQMRPYFG